MANKPHHDADTNDIIYRGPEPGKDLYGFGPRAFNIAFGNDTRYWKLPQRGSNDPAELVKVSWLQVTGLAAVKHGKKYKITFELSMKANSDGWKNNPVYLMAKIGRSGKYQLKRLERLDQIKGRANVPDSFDDIFEVSVPKTVWDNRLFFGLYEVWSGKWKEGLRIHSATVQEISED